MRSPSQKLAFAQLICDLLQMGQDTNLLYEPHSSSGSMGTFLPPEILYCI